MVRTLSIASRQDLRLEALEVTIEARAKRVPFGAVGARFRHHDEIPRGQRALQPERLPRDPFQTVAVDGPPRDATRDREPESCYVASARAREHGEISITRTDGVCEDTPELLRRVQA